MQTHIHLDINYTLAHICVTFQVYCSKGYSSSEFTAVLPTLLASRCGHVSYCGGISGTGILLEMSVQSGMQKIDVGRSDACLSQDYPQEKWLPSNSQHSLCPALLSRCRHEGNRGSHALRQHHLHQSSP